MNPIVLPDNSRAVSFTLNTDWSLAKSDANSIEHSRNLDQNSLQWIDAFVPGTVAQSIEINDKTPDLDTFDWWYRCEFFKPNNQDKSIAQKGERTYLCMDGLASLADVWLNNELVIHSSNMFVPSRVDISKLLQDTNQLCICFRSLSKYMAIKRPRPKWKTRLIGNQQLRWARTTLLGRIPCWQPMISPVGPWREIRLEQVPHIELIESQLSTTLNGSTGKIDGAFSLKSVSEDIQITSASLEADQHCLELEIEKTSKQTRIINLSAKGDIPSAPQWWPHTHGQPELLSFRLRVKTNEGEFSFELGRRGFKNIQLLESANTLGFNINGVDIFCRGACWTSNDIISLQGDSKTLRQSLLLARDANINMLRVGGTMLYEADSFYETCDELGIMVWQDFMFASMDYPVEDVDFHNNIVYEANCQLARLSAHTSISVYCGNTDVQQQAAMMGAPKDVWSNTFFDSELASLCQQRHPGIPYFSSTPCGGALPFHPNQGLAHYYGVGAFMRPLSDIGLADIKFASEGMGFSHIPEPSIIDQVFNGEKPILHDPRWKKVVPRDAGAGWDFEDVRDHYLEQMFQQDPTLLRSYDPDRYLEVSRIVSGEMLYRVFSLWRSTDNHCRGGLLWFYKDLVAGPGWGLIDSDNKPKAAYFAIRHAFFPLGIFLEDKGLNGFHIHIINETSSSRNITIEIKAYRKGNILTLEGSTEIILDARDNKTLIADEILEYFSDANYAYRFGPVQHEIIHVRLLDTATGEHIDDDSYFPITHNMPILKKPEIEVTFIKKEIDEIFLRLCSTSFLQFVRLDLKTHQSEDNYFHLAPNSPRDIRLFNSDAESTNIKPEIIKGYLEALNLPDPIKLHFNIN